MLFLFWIFNKKKLVEHLFIASEDYDNFQISVKTCYTKTDTAYWLRDVALDSSWPGAFWLNYPQGYGDSFGTTSMPASDAYGIAFCFVIG